MLSYLQLTYLIICLEGGRIVVDDNLDISIRQRLADDIWGSQAISNSNNFLAIEFTTVEEYLFLLENAAKELSRFGARVMFVLAAAVSDFYIPFEKVSKSMRSNLKSIIRTE